MPQHVNTHVGVDPFHRFTEDPCESRHNGNVDSRTAWEKVSPRRQKTYQKILAFYHDSPDPISPKEIAQLMEVHLNVISGRFTELKEMEILHPIDDTFEGSRRLELVSRMRPSPLAELAEPAARQPSKACPIDDNCVEPCCTTDALLEAVEEEVASQGDFC
jgi:hypothetical protein